MRAHDNNIHSFSADVVVCFVLFTDMLRLILAHLTTRQRADRSLLGVTLWLHLKNYPKYNFFLFVH